MEKPLETPTPEESLVGVLKCCIFCQWYMKPRSQEMDKSALFGYLWKELAAANEVKTMHSLQNMKINIVFIFIMKKYS